MKKLILLFIAALLVTSSFASSIIDPEVLKPKASAIFILVGKNGKAISLMGLSTISTKDYQALTGEKMNFLEKISFKLGQKKLKKMINADGTVDNKKFERSGSYNDKGIGFWGAFFLGLFLSIFGLIACISIHAREETMKHHKAKVAGALIGFGVGTIILLLLLL